MNLVHLVHFQFNSCILSVYLADFTKYKTGITLTCVCDIHTRIMNVSFSGSFNSCASKCRCPPEDVSYEFVAASSTVLSISCSSYLDVRWEVGGRLAAFRIGSEQHAASFCSSHLAFFPNFLVVQLYNSTDKATGWKNSRFILSEKSDFHMIDSRLKAVHASPTRIMTSLFVDEILL